MFRLTFAEDFYIDTNTINNARIIINILFIISHTYLNIIILYQYKYESDVN